MASTTAEATESSLEIELTKKSTRKDGTRNSEGKKRRRVNTIYLWEFLLDLLANDDLRTIICWSRREFKEFKLKRPEEVSRRWGLVKRKKGMNYEKLSRALRFYYGQGIIQKIPGQPFTYKFDRLPYKYEPRVSKSSDQESKTSSSNREQEKISSDKSTLHKTGQSSLSSSSEQSTLSPAETPRGRCTSPCLVPILAESAQASRETVEYCSPQESNISSFSRKKIESYHPQSCLKRNQINSTKATPVPVIKRVASYNCQ